MAGLLSNHKNKLKEKYERQFISLYDSVLYLGEPHQEALEFITQNINNQSILYLSPSGIELVRIYKNDCDDNYDMWLWGGDEFCGESKELEQILQELSYCINQGKIEPNSPIYCLGFGKKQFLNILVNYGVEVPQYDLETAQSPDFRFDDDCFYDLDPYTIKSIIDERDELRAYKEQQENAKATTKDISTKTKNAIAKIILALLELSELDWQNADPYDYTNPNSINSLICSQLEQLKLSVSNRFVGDWIKQAQEQAK